MLKQADNREFVTLHSGGRRRKQPPQTRSCSVSQTDSNHALRIYVDHNSELSSLVKCLDNPEFEKSSHIEIVAMTMIQ